MKTWIVRLLPTALFAMLVGVGHAKSTTTVALSTDGNPIPGQTIQIHVVLTGKHYVYAGGCTFYSGKIDLSEGSSVLNSTYPTTQNSDVTATETVPTPSNTGCYDSNTGTWYAVKVFGDYTEYSIPYQLPSTTGDYLFTATFAGDGEANGSTSPTLTVSARYPSNTAILNYLLSD